MRAVVRHDVGDIRLDDVPGPTVQDPELLTLVRTGAIDPTTVLTQVGDVPSVLDAHETSDRRQNGWTSRAPDPSG